MSKLQEANIRLVGASLYSVHSFVTDSFYDGVKTFYLWYKDPFSQSEYLEKIDTQDIGRSFTEAKNKDQSKIYFLYTIEGFECLRTPKDIIEFYNLGVRIFGPAWATDNRYASGRDSKNDAGLSNLGKEVVKELSQKSSLIDITHLSENSVKDLRKNYKGPIVTSHSNLRSVFHTPHNITDIISLMTKCN